MTPLELLKAARADLTDPSHWMQRFAAVNRFGVETDPKSESACCWCAFGIVAKHDPSADPADALGPTGEAAFDALDQAAATILSPVSGKFLPALGIHAAIFLNDNGTHKTALEMFDLAITSLENTDATV